MTDYSNYAPDDDFKKKEQQQKDELKDATEKTVEAKYSNYDVTDGHKIKELEQEKKIAESTVEEYKVKAKSTKKKLSILIISMIFVGGLFGIYGFFAIDDDIVVSGDEMRSQFVIQNLKGDTIDTWISWKVTEGDLFHIHVKDSQYATQERLDAILDVIMSDEEIELDDSLVRKGPKGTASTYYTGWNGALNSIDDTEFNLVKNLHFDVSDKGEGHILVDLTNLSNADGYAGYTKSIVDQEQHQILKSTITIYNIESLGIEQLKTIFRHELGHGFGLAHSTATEDLMAPTITTNYPYISECDLDAIALLYNGGQSSQVVCEK